jgi:hypothetical protein
MAKKIAMGLRPILSVGAMTVNMQVKDGEIVKESKVFSFDDLPTNIQEQLKLGGLSTILQQRVSDIKENPLAKLEAMQDVYDRWMTGEWAKEREGGLRMVPAIVEVLAQLKNCEVSQAQKAYAKLTDEVKGQLKEKYKAECEAVEAKRGQAEVSLDDLLV